MCARGRQRRSGAGGSADGTLADGQSAAPPWPVRRCAPTQWAHGRHRPIHSSSGRPSFRAWIRAYSRPYSSLSTVLAPKPNARPISIPRGTPEPSSAAPTVAQVAFATGSFSEARLVVLGRKYRLNFFDPVRLAQEVQSALHRGAVFFESNVVVVPSLTRENMERAAAEVMRSGNVASLIAESLP